MITNLVIAGTGILGVGHLSLETLDHIEHSDKVFYLVADPVTEEYIIKNNPRAESLQVNYRDNGSRLDAYDGMVRTVVNALGCYNTVLALFYGHPAVFVHPSHKIMTVATAQGHSARMLPGISAEDCLFADLGVDPGILGCHTYEASDFLIYDRAFDSRTPLVLWQAGAIGDPYYRKSGYKTGKLNFLVNKLASKHPLNHEIVLYEASQYAICKPRIDRIALSELVRAEVTAITSLFVPHSEASLLNQSMLAALRPESDFMW